LFCLSVVVVITAAAHYVCTLSIEKETIKKDEQQHKEKFNSRVHLFETTRLAQNGDSLINAEVKCLIRS
jgi:hypothetical protein